MNKKMLGLLMLVVSLLLVVGCSSDSGASPDEEEKSEHADVFEETDKLALEFYQAGFELNIPKAHSMLSPAGQEKLEDEPYVTGIAKEDGSDLHASELVDPQDYEKYKEKGSEEFKDFDQLKDGYEIRRYDYVYSDESKEIIYYVKPWRGYEFEDGDSNFISLKQNEGGEWKVKQFIDRIPEPVTNKNSGTVIHPYEENKGENEDEYGFE
ncbi:hypothetical protein [Virgibacillus ainsalahensis]